MKIGSFLQDSDGTLTGRITGLGIGSIPVIFQEEVSRKGEPFFKIIADPVGEAYEIGAAFPKQKGGMNFHSVALDSPVFAAPLNAALFYEAATGNYNLVWDRPEPQGPKPNLEATSQQAKTGNHRAPSPQV